MFAKRLLLVAGLTLLGCVGDDLVVSPVDAGAATPDGRDASDPAQPTDDGGGPKAGEPLDLDIHVLRNPTAAGHPAYGAKVRVKGLVVSGVKVAGPTHGFFAQHEENVAWGGVYVYLGAAAVSVVRGDIVTVTGEYATYRSQDQIHATPEGVQRTASTPNVKSFNVTLADIADSGSRALELQSVLLSVKDVEVVRATQGVDFRVRPIGGASTELAVTSFVANDVGPSPFQPNVGDQYGSIQGVGYRSGVTEVTATNKLAPFGPGDLSPK
ncbi:MAG: hypothetical protein KIT84_41260 [Labilithrix sp.]|nr:hypothetical protein [Labilithrix sp.]MCW5817500.1 hypothetical protein [Labilithrix sp.]